jgi:hypothetical protein
VADPCRRLLTKAEERLSKGGREKLLGLLRAGDPHGDVATMWEAKEAVRELYAHSDPLSLSTGSSGSEQISTNGTPRSP